MQREVQRVPISEDVATIVRLRRAAVPADCPCQPLRAGVDEVAVLMRPKPRIVARN